MDKYFSFQAIGYVKSPIKEMVDENWGKVESKIILRDELKDGLHGLNQFSHAIIVTVLHQAKFDIDHHLQRHPREQKDLPKLGIFSQRAKHRPNPIGISTVQTIAVKGNCLTVKGLDAIDSTPVIDIKPYFPHYDCVTDSVIPDWVNKVMELYF